jgi:hypothetical protein
MKPPSPGGFIHFQKIFKSSRHNYFETHGIRREHNNCVFQLESQQNQDEATDSGRSINVIPVRL